MGRSKLIRDSNDRIKIFDRDEWLLKRQRERATKLLDEDKSQQKSVDKSGLEKPPITYTTTGSQPSATSPLLNTCIDSYDEFKSHGDSKNVDNSYSKMNSSGSSVSRDRNDPLWTNRVGLSTKHHFLTWAILFYYPIFLYNYPLSIYMAKF